MDRLTRNIEGVYEVKSPSVREVTYYRENGKADHDAYTGEAIDKLGAYEDTGLTPARAKELAEAEREGRLVVLPADADICQYAVVPMNCEYSDCPIEDEAGNCPAITNPNLSIPDCCPRIIVQVVPGRQRFEDLVGLQIYATHEEAEAALKEIK